MSTTEATIDPQAYADAVEQTYNATLIERIDINPVLAIFRVRPDQTEGGIPDFKPGQYATIGLAKTVEESAAENAARVAAGRTVRDPNKPKFVRRPYSIASGPAEKDALELFIVKVDDGLLTPRLWDVQQGQRLWIDLKIKGVFTVEDVEKGKDVVMVGTGTGLAPFISMVRTYRDQGFWNRLAILHGVRYASDLGYRAELKALAASDPNITYLPCVTREPSDSDYAGHRGRVTDFMEAATFEQTLGWPLNPETSRVLLCGSPAMIEQIEGTLLPRGFITHSKKTPGNLHVEKYW